MRPSLMWIIGSAAAALVFGYAFLNFWAAIDLGYDAHPGGKAIIERWGNIMLASFGVAAGCGAMAFRARRARR